MTAPDSERVRSGRRSDPTIFDLARAASVSKTTASRVLNGAPNVAPETRARVLEAIARIDYRVNAAARTLRTTRSFLAGYLVPAVSNDVFGKLADVLDEELRHEGIGLLIATSGWHPEGEQQAFESLRARNVDALVLSLSNDRDPRVAERIRSAGIPVVLIDREVKGLAADVVLSDGRRGVKQAVRHLADLGHRRLGVAVIDLLVRPGREALAGFRAGTEEAGVENVGEIVVEYERVDRGMGHEIASRLIANGATGIISSVPTTVTAGVLEGIHKAGLRVPRDVSVVGFDESDLASVISPPLTVIARSLEQVSRYASRLIASRLIDDTQPPRVENVDMRLLVRESTGPPPAPQAVAGQVT
jgi:LacI family transcriptional regulator